VLGQTLELARCGRGVGLTFRCTPRARRRPLHAVVVQPRRAEPRDAAGGTDVEMAAVFPTRPRPSDAFAAAGP
jgi:hypothetical protein